MRRVLLSIALFASASFGCTGVGEGMEPAKIPPDVQEDYTVFAQRCSKCHSLARPLQSGISEDVFWEHYVARMKRMPASGITDDDEVKILRFLKYYAAEQRKKKQGAATSTWGTL